MGKKRLVVLTGAGMSAESGISTFRDSDGLWEQYPVQKVASIEGFRENPQLVLDFYTARRRDFVGCKPNAGHYALAALQEEWEMTIITQNIDDLHERAGSRHVIHLHGEILKNCSVAHPDITYPVDMEHPEIKVGDLAPDGRASCLCAPRHAYLFDRSEACGELLSKGYCLYTIYGFRRGGKTCSSALKISLSSHIFPFFLLSTFLSLPRGLFLPCR